MTKVLLIDADGVVIVGKYFSERLSEKFGIPLERVLRFFKNEYTQCVLGKADLKKELAKFISLWKWKDSLDALLDFWFSGDAICQDIIEIIDTLRKRGMRCYIVSDNEMQRARYLMDTMGLSRHVDGGFFSCEVGHTKSEQAFFENILAKLSDVMPAEIFYWDDDEKNIEIAKRLGIRVGLYDGLPRFKEAIKKEVAMS